MNPLEIFHYAFEALRERRTRSILTILMVLISAALLTALNGMNAGMENFLTSRFSTLSPNVLVVIPGTETRGGGFSLSPSSKITLGPTDVNLVKKVRGVEEVVPIIEGVARLRSGARSLRVSVVGMDQSKINLIYPTAELEEGCFVPPYDSTGIVLGSQVAKPPWESRPLASVGQVVSLEYEHASMGPQNRLEKETIKRSFLVRGILAYTGAPGFANIDRSALISLHAASILFKKAGKYDALLVVTASPDLNDQVKEDILNLYSNNVIVISPEAIVQVIKSAMAGFSTFTVSIATVSLVVAAVGIITTLFTSVMERTREIGLLKALGFKNSHILAMFLSEALIIGLIGGSLGLLAGYLGANFLLARPIRFGPGPGVFIQPLFQAETLILIWVFTLVVSLIAGFYPAWRGSRLNPVEALRRE